MAAGVADTGRLGPEGGVALVGQRERVDVGPQRHGRSLVGADIADHPGFRQQRRPEPGLGEDVEDQLRGAVLLEPELGIDVQVPAEVDETVLVSFGSSGSFRFILDTGASFTLVDRTVVNKLHLPVIGPKRTLTGIFGSGPARVVRVEDWKVDDVPLPTSEIYTASGPVFDPFISGLLGSGPVCGS